MNFGAAMYMDFIILEFLQNVLLRMMNLASIIAREKKLILINFWKGLVFNLRKFKIHKSTECDYGNDPTYNL